MRKLPIIQGLANDGKYKELLRGYMDNNFSVSDLATLKIQWMLLRGMLLQQDFTMN